MELATRSNTRLIEIMANRLPDSLGVTEGCANDHRTDRKCLVENSTLVCHGVEGSIKYSHEDAQGTSRTGDIQR